MDIVIFSNIVIKHYVIYNIDIAQLYFYPTQQTTGSLVAD